MKNDINLQDAFLNVVRQQSGAFIWVMVNLAISTVILLLVNLLETKNRRAVKS